MGNQCIRKTNQGTPRRRSSIHELENKENSQLENQPKQKKNKQTNQQMKLQIKSNSNLATIKTTQGHLYCLICKEKYNKSARLPVKICQESHTICSVCKDMLLSTKVQRFKICPFCKRLLHSVDIVVNQALLASLQ